MIWNTEQVKKNSAFAITATGAILVVILLIVAKRNPFEIGFIGVCAAVCVLRFFPPVGQPKGAPTTPATPAPAQVAPRKTYFGMFFKFLCFGVGLFIVWFVIHAVGGLVAVSNKHQADSPETVVSAEIPDGLKQGPKNLKVPADAKLQTLTKEWYEMVVPPGEQWFIRLQDFDDVLEVRATNDILDNEMNPVGQKPLRDKPWEVGGTQNTSIDFPTGADHFFVRFSTKNRKEKTRVWYYTK